VTSIAPTRGSLTRKTLTHANTSHPNTHTHTHTLIHSFCLLRLSVSVEFSLPSSHSDLLCFSWTRVIFFAAAERMKGVSTRIQTMTVSFPVASEFMCDCSTIWSRPIYSRPPPPPPRSLKVTAGDFGRGVLELPCQREALRRHVCRRGWSLGSRAAPCPDLKHEATSLREPQVHSLNNPMYTSMGIHVHARVMFC